MYPFLFVNSTKKLEILLNFKNLCTFNPPNTIAIILSCWKKKLLKRKIMLEKKKMIVWKTLKIEKKKRNTTIGLDGKNIPFYPKTLLLKSFCALLTHTRIHIVHTYSITTYTTQKRLQKSGWNTETDHDHEIWKKVCLFPLKMVVNLYF